VAIGVEWRSILLKLKRASVTPDLELNVNYLPVCTQTINNWCDLRLDRERQRVLPIVATTATTCPAELNRLSELLVRDLPSYANRILQQRRKRTDVFYSSMQTASAPDLRPLENLSREYPPRFPQRLPTQVFITTLERQYTGIRSAQLQQFHWLFLAKTRLGWRLVNIYSRTGGAPEAGTPVSPPIESSRTIVGEAIRIWLNDCYLGKVKG
jgi:hypothetical protein